MNQSILLHPFTGVDIDGDPSFDTDVSINAYIVRKAMVIKSAHGTEVVTKYRLLFYTEDVISTKSFITINGTREPILLANEFQSLRATGPTLREIFL